MSSDSRLITGNRTAKDIILAKLRKDKEEEEKKRLREARQEQEPQPAEPVPQIIYPRLQEPCRPLDHITEELSNERILEKRRKSNLGLIYLKPITEESKISKYLK